MKSGKMKEEMIEKTNINLEGESGSSIALTETLLKSRLTTFSPLAPAPYPHRSKNKVLK